MNWSGDDPQNSADQPPKAPKNRSQQPSQSHIPQHSANDKTGVIPQAQITPADSEAQIQPYPACNSDKHQIRQMGVPGAQRTEKTINYTKTCPQYQGDEQSVQDSVRCGHRKSRPQKLPFARGSS